MSYLVWSLESSLIGVWAIALSIYSNSFHSFIARSHAIVSGLTLVLHLVSAARNLGIHGAIADAFACTVSALLLIYIAVLLDPSKYSGFFVSSSIIDGLIPLDACVGLAWFTAAIVSALGMALSEKGRSTPLMFHHFGYHMSVVLPSLTIIWLYDYTASNGQEPIHQFIALFQTVTHWALFLTLVCIYGAFVALQAIGEGLKLEMEWPRYRNMSFDVGTRYGLHVIIKLIGRGGPLIIAFSAVIVANTFPQSVLGWSLFGVAAINTIDFFEAIGAILLQQAEIPTAQQPINDDLAPSAPTTEQSHRLSAAQESNYHDPAAITVSMLPTTHQNRGKMHPYGFQKQTGSSNQPSQSRDKMV